MRLHRGKAMKILSRARPILSFEVFILAKLSIRRLWLLG